VDRSVVTSTVRTLWDDDIVPSLSQLVAVPAISPAFDPDWEEHGEPAAAIEHVRAWIASRSLPGAVLEVEGGPNRPPLQASASQALFARAQELAAEAGLEALESIAVGGASDGNFTAGVRPPVRVGLGAVGGGAHADDEHVIVARIPGRTALLAILIKDQLGA